MDPNNCGASSASCRAYIRGGQSIGPRAGSDPRAPFLWPAEGFPNQNGCGQRKRATEVFFNNWRNWTNSKLNGTRAKKQKNVFLDLWENITPSWALLLKVTPICCFATFLARADPRGSCTIPSVMGRRLQLISHPSIVQTLFSPHPLS